MNMVKLHLHVKQEKGKLGKKSCGSAFYIAGIKDPWPV
jgi:hypothetical protein